MREAAGKCYRGHASAPGPDRSRAEVNKPRSRQRQALCWQRHELSTLIQGATVINPFERELLQTICTTCNLLEVDIDGFDADAPLLGPDSPLGIDSLDALEIVVMVQKEYGVRIESENTSRIVLQTLATLAAHIKSHRSLELRQP